MSNFVIPNWDSNGISDEICNKLFKRKTGSTKVKSKFQNGRIEKAKRKRLTQNIKENFETAKKGIENNAKFQECKTKVKKLVKENIPSNLKSKPTKLVDSMKMNMLKKRSKEGTHLLSDNETSFNDKTVTQKNKKNKRKKKIKNLKDKISNFIDSDIDKLKSSDNKKKSKNTKTIDKLKKEKSTENDNLLKKTPKKKNMSLRQRMMEKLKASRFRYLNEQIYSNESEKAQELFNNDPEAFQAYHEGYRQQIERWPINPVDIIISSIKKMPKNHQIADFGCGDAKISQSVQQEVHSFDLVASNERVIACDVTKTPLKNESIDVVVFCLSLMGTNLHDHFKEANRVLKIGGILKIAEVESRFDNVDEFIKGVRLFGFKNTLKDLSHNLFYFMDFKKISNLKRGRNLPTISLHPCLYKKR